MQAILQHFLKRSGYGALNIKDFDLQMKIHPDYPSFKSLTDTLDYFKVENIAAHVPVSSFKQLPKNFLTIIKVGNANEVVSIEKQKEKVKIKFENRTRIVSIEEFYQAWIPNIIVIEPNEVQIHSKRSFRDAIFPSLVIFSLLAVIWFNSFNSISIVFFFISLAGTILSYFTSLEESDTSSTFLNKICNSAGRSNCTDIINSNSKIFQTLSFSDLGVVYFSTLTIFSLIYGYQSPLLLPLILSVPVVLYSFFLQAFKFKRFCAVCITISFIDLVLVIIAAYQPNFNYNPLHLAALLMLGLLTYFLNMMSTKQIKRKKEDENKIYSLTRFKRDPQVFQYLFNNSNKISSNRHIHGEIVLGNPNADFVIIALTNPFCGYCKGAFQSYKQLLSNDKNIQIRLRFNVETENFSSPATKISVKLLEIFSNGDSIDVIKAYEDWFEDRNPEKWLAKYGTPNSIKVFSSILTEQKEWATKNGINFTPATIIGEKFYPKKYEYEELPFFISELKLQSKVKENIPSLA